MNATPLSIATPTNRAVPWRYSLGITIIHRGSTTEELVTSLTGVLGTISYPGTVSTISSA